MSGNGLEQAEVGLEISLQQFSRQPKERENTELKSGLELEAGAI